MGATFRALRNPNFRLFATGQLLSASGRWMHQVAELWLVLQLTNSPTALGTVTALRFAPLLVFGVWGGLVADRFDKRAVLMISQVAVAMQAVALGVFATLGLTHVWVVFLLSFVYGCVSIVDTPLRRSFIVEIVGREDIVNGIGLNSAIITLSRSIGPAAGGLVIAWAGVGACFFINAFSYLAMIAALWLMNSSLLNRVPVPVRSPGQVREGLRYAWTTPTLRTPLVMVAVISTLSWNFPVVLPPLATETFDADASAYGILYAMVGLGSLVGALSTARRRTVSMRSLPRLALAFGTALALIGIAPGPEVTAVGLIVVGASGTSFFTSSNSTIQLVSPPQMQGRIMALYAILFAGSTAVGAPIVGLITEAFGPRVGLLFGGMVAVVVAGLVTAVWRWRREPAVSPPA